MTRTTLFLLPVLALIACGTGNSGRTIELTVEGGAGRTVYFDRFESNRPMHVDSVVLDASGKGTLHAPALPLDFYRIALDDEQLIIALDSSDELVIRAAAGTLDSPASVSGSEHTELLQEFYRKGRAYEADRDSARAAIAAMPGDTAAIARFNALNTSFYNTCKEFAQQHPGSPVALTAVSKLDIQRELPLFKQVRDDLRKVMPRSGFFAMFRDQVDRVEQQEIAMKLQEEEMKRLSNLLPLESEAPEIRQQTPDGGTLALSDLRGSYVLIDFWASWCRPCRIENPNVKRIYERFHEKGFEILGVSLDRDLGAWQKAIQDDRLPWKHVSDLGFWNNAAAQEYGVNSIPYTVLVDREGRIIEKGLRAHELEPKLEQLLGR